MFTELRVAEAADSFIFYFRGAGARGTGKISVIKITSDISQTFWSNGLNDL